MYNYIGCGLDNIQLRDGYEFRRTLSGQEVVHIEDVADLHRALAQWVCNLARPLSPKEFKFLRRELDMSPRDMATLVGVDEQVVLAWERGERLIDVAADRLLRLRVTERIAT